MQVTEKQYENIQVMRQQLLDTEAARRTLCFQLVNMGLFQSADTMLAKVKKTPEAMHTIIRAVGMLESLGLWDEDVFMALLGQMAKLPMPTVKGDTNGETT